MRSPVLVCFAVSQEARPFRRSIHPGSHVNILLTGMGQRNAERTAGAALDSVRPLTVITAGFAGALVPGLRVGDVVFETSEANLALRLVQAGARPARFCCATRIAVTRADKAALREQHRADAVEMESAVIQQLCEKRGVSCATVRAISDTADEDLPLDFNALLTVRHDPDFVRIAIALLRAPHKLPALLRLGRDSAFAARQLAGVLSAVIGG